MTKFKLKILGKNIEILQDGEVIGEGNDYKEVLAYIATLIIKEDIDDYEIWLYEKGEKVKLEEKDFNPKAIIKNSKKIKIDDDDDDDDDDSKRNRIEINSKNKQESSRPRFVYTPKNTYEDYINIGKKFAENFSNKKEIKVESIKENDS